MNQHSLSDVYSQQVSGRKSINTIGLTSSKGLQTQFERDPLTKQLENKLSQTLSKIMAPAVQNIQKQNINILPEIEDDAQSNILKAMEELKKLNAL
jgi:hypothetical protein